MALYAFQTVPDSVGAGSRGEHWIRREAGRGGRNILTKLQPPNSVGVPQLAAQTGISRDAFYGWRREVLGGARRPGASTVPAGTLGSEEKCAVVVETATLNELELGAYCRRKGLFA